MTTDRFTTEDFIGPYPRARYRYRYMADSEQAGIIHYRRSVDTAPCVIYAESEAFLGLFSY